jgi:hypothetical protein
MVVSATRYVIFERTPQVGGSTPFFAFFYEWHVLCLMRKLPNWQYLDVEIGWFTPPMALFTAKGQVIWCLHWYPIGKICSLATLEIRTNLESLANYMTL